MSGCCKYMKGLQLPVLLSCGVYSLLQGMFLVVLVLYYAGWVILSVWLLQTKHRIKRLQKSYRWLLFCFQGPNHRSCKYTMNKINFVVVIIELNITLESKCLWFYIFFIHLFYDTSHFLIPSCFLIVREQVVCRLWFVGSDGSHETCHTGVLYTHQLLRIGNQLIILKFVTSEALCIKTEELHNLDEQTVTSNIVLKAQGALGGWWFNLCPVSQ